MDNQLLGIPGTPGSLRLRHASLRLRLLSLGAVLTQEPPQIGTLRKIEDLGGQNGIKLWIF
jgi:hypothetical protein